MTLKKLLGWIAAGIILASPAFGHAKLLSSTPSADARVTEPPKSLLLKFNENVKLAHLSLSLEGEPKGKPKGEPISVKIVPNPTDSPDVTIALPALSPGTYRVQWTALTLDDGHVVKGSYSFVIQGPG